MEPCVNHEEAGVDNHIEHLLAVGDAGDQFLLLIVVDPWKDEEHSRVGCGQLKGIRNEFDGVVLF